MHMHMAEGLMYETMTEHFCNSRPSLVLYNVTLLFSIVPFPGTTIAFLLVARLRTLLSCFKAHTPLAGFPPAEKNKHEQA